MKDSGPVIAGGGEADREQAVPDDETTLLPEGADPVAGQLRAGDSAEDDVHRMQLGLGVVLVVIDPHAPGR